MKTDTIRITDAIESRAAAMRETERFCAYYPLTGMDAMHMRLLTEETLSIVHGIFKGFHGEFWVESDVLPDGLDCRICVAADVLATAEQETALREFSTSGENEAAQGIGGMIRELFRCYVQSISHAVPSQQWQAVEMIYGDGMLYGDSFEASCWSLDRYRAANETKEETDAPQNDTFERSIIAKLADDVRVGITSERASVVIEKRLPRVE